MRQAPNRRLSVVSATSCARRRLIRRHCYAEWLSTGKSGVEAQADAAVPQVVVRVHAGAAPSRRAEPASQNRAPPRQSRPARAPPPAPRPAADAPASPRPSCPSSPGRPPSSGSARAPPPCTAPSAARRAARSTSRTRPPRSTRAGRKPRTRPPSPTAAPAARAPPASSPPTRADAPRPPLPAPRWPRKFALCGRPVRCSMPVSCLPHSVRPPGRLPPGISAPLRLSSFSSSAMC